jgi:replicative DNA helicase
MGALRNPEAETYVLGAILLDNRALDDVTDVLTVDDFTSDFTREAFAALERLVEQGPTDEMQLAAALGLTEPHLVKAIYELTERVPSAASVRSYALRVATAGRLRRLHDLCLEVAAETDAATIATEEEALSFFADAQQRFVNATTFGRAKHLTTTEVMTRVLRTAEERSQMRGRIPGIPTGLQKLDDLLLGLRRKHLVIVGAKTGVGKTAFTLGLARAVARNGKRGFFCSYEMGAEELGLRMLSAEAKVPSMRVEMGTLDEHDFARLAIAVNGLGASQIVWTDNPPPTVPRLRAECQALKRRGGLDVVYVDYLQLLEGAKNTQNREREIGEISRGLKKLAMELDVTVVALSQLNRKTDRHAEPTLADLRDSGSIEQDANVVIFLWSDEDDSPEVHGRVAKHRGGPVGSFELNFKRSIQRFEERPT